MNSRITGSVRIVGAGLLGTSIGLALSKQGVDVIVSDASPAAQSLAVDYGAGRLPQADDQPALIVVCVPPDITADIVAAELAAHPLAVVTDVASVKSAVLSSLENSGVALERYVGSHPMAGRERGGAISGRADLFIGRTWVISPTQSSSAEAVSRVEQLALALGASPLQVPAAEHDRAVALVSHLPQVVASLTAGQLVDAELADVQLAGQGIRDTIRIASSDPKLWIQILSANASGVLQVLKGLARDLDGFISALENINSPGSLSAISSALDRGNQGVARLPGKHGAKATHYATVTVMIDDKPGELARLLTEVGEANVNLEEIKLEHSPSSQIGLVELFVLPTIETHLINELTARGWRMVA
ncbi:MAG: prephenate dehydrogenase [Micrococcales bacterium]